MSEFAQDEDLIERRKTWKTVSFGGITTYDPFYDAYCPDAKFRMGDIRRIRGHKDALLRDDVDEICEQVWDDIFVSPNVLEMLEMDVYKINTLIDLVAVPHANVFGYIGPTIHLFERTMQAFSTFPSADEFLRGLRALSMIDAGAKIGNRLTKDNSHGYFERLLQGKVKLVPEDFRSYKRQKRDGSCAEEVLFLPGWVRHRLSHPENRYERRFPDAGDYGRATYMLSAITLTLLYERQEPLFD